MSKMSDKEIGRNAAKIRQSLVVIESAIQTIATSNKNLSDEIEKMQKEVWYGSGRAEKWYKQMRSNINDTNEKKLAFENSARTLANIAGSSVD